MNKERKDSFNYDEAIGKKIYKDLFELGTDRNAT